MSDLNQWFGPIYHNLPRPFMKVVQSAPVKSFLVLDRKSPDTMLHGAYYMQHIGCLLDASGNIGYTDSLEFFYPAPVQSHFSHQVVKNL